MVYEDNADSRTSPPREDLEQKGDLDRKEAITSRGVDPETLGNERTKELATDQSIAGRYLLYHPNQSCLDVIERCADGIGSITERLSPTGDKDADLQKDKILITMLTRLMSDGGTAPVKDFNSRLAALKDPTLANYDELVHQLAEDCRQNMLNIRTTAKIPGPEGALGRQGVLAFMGDLGGLEPNETGFGGGFAAPLTKKLEIPYEEFRVLTDSLCNAGRLTPADEETLNKFAQNYLQAQQAGEVFRALTDGLCDAQRKLLGQKEPATQEELDKFAEAFLIARQNTSMKGGSLSAPAHTEAKKGERAAISFKPVERHGLHNTGDAAEEILKKADPEHQTSLRNAAWPQYYVSKDLVKGVVEPVTGHVSGTFGEMVVMMNMLCGTPPDTMTYDNPAGTQVSSANQEKQTIAIAALAVSELGVSGFHSAVEVHQPTSTFTTQATHKSLGPEAVEEAELQAAALRAYADNLDSGGMQSKFEYPIPKLDDPVGMKRYVLTEDELTSNKEQLLTKAESIEMEASKSTDMISLLQGEGGTLATIEISSMLANQSVDPIVARQLISTATRLEAVSLRGHTPELEKARTIANEPVSEAQKERLLVALTNAETVADQIDLLYKRAEEAKANMSRAEENVKIAALMVNSLQERLEDTRKALDKAAQPAGPPPKELTVAGLISKFAAAEQSVLLEKKKMEIIKELRSEWINLQAAKAEKTAATLTVTAINTELTSANSAMIVAAKAEAIAATKEALAIKRKGQATEMTNRAEEAEYQASAQKIEEKQQAFQSACQERDGALQLFRNATDEEKPVAFEALRSAFDKIELLLAELNKEVLAGPSVTETNESRVLRQQATILQTKAGEATADAIEARAVAKAMYDKLKDTSDIFKEAKSQIQEMLKTPRDPESPTQDGTTNPSNPGPTGA